MAAAPAGGYVAQLDEPRKRQIETLHAMIRKAAPGLKPAIVSGMIGYGTCHYKYASGREGEAPVIALASQKQYISLYVCATNGDRHVAEQFKSALPKASIGKSCIRFKKLEDVDLAVLRQIVGIGARWKGTE